jgi:hypothetical protein
VRDLSRGGCADRFAAMARRSGGRGRIDSDEHYVLDLCDEALGEIGLRQHRFAWLVGDPSPQTGRTVALPVDGYWPAHNLVVEFYERQHSEAVPFFDKPDRMTVSGVSRGEQRALYDERRRQLIPKQGIRLVVVTLDTFESKRGKINRAHERDVAAVAKILNDSTAPEG